MGYRSALLPLLFLLAACQLPGIALAQHLDVYPVFPAEYQNRSGVPLPPIDPAAIPRGEAEQMATESPELKIPDPPELELAEIDIQAAESRSNAALESDFQDSSRRSEIGPDFYAPGDFVGGIPIPGTNAAIKIGGYVKVDMIQDFNPIDETDFFDTTTIPVDAFQRTNTRFHARQSRLNFDTRWPTQHGPGRVFVEADFFGDGDQWRLRHAYGELKNVLIGQTWTTFTDNAALPTTLDNEGSASSMSRRQAQVRWTQPIFFDGLSLSFSAENPETIIELPDFVDGESRNPTPDFISRVRFSTDWGRFQVAGLWRQLGFQPVDSPVVTEDAWGFNFTGSLDPTDGDHVYYQILFGEGIGSYKNLPDIAPSGPNLAATIPLFSWMIGWNHEWSDRLSSNFTYSQSRLDTFPLQPGGDLHQNSYFAVNLIWQPVERVYAGVEYLFGTRENVDGGRGEANRLQASVFFYLP